MRSVLRQQDGVVMDAMPDHMQYHHVSLTRSTPPTRRRVPITFIQ